MKSYILYTLFSLHWNSTPFPLILCFSSFLFSHLISSSLFLFSFSLSVFASFLFIFSPGPPSSSSHLFFYMLLSFTLQSSSYSSIFTSFDPPLFFSSLPSSSLLWWTHGVCCVCLLVCFSLAVNNSYGGMNEFSQSLWCNHFSFSTGSTGSRMLMAGETLRVRIWSVWCF